MSVQIVNHKKLWRTCEACGIQALAEDMPLHIKTCCPPSQQNWTHGFICKSVLHGWIVKMSNNEDKLDKCLHRVYMSAEALLQCNITIGEYVVVTVGNKLCVKRAWISPERSSHLTSILMPKIVLDGVWRTTTGDATVQTLQTKPIPAHTVIVTLKSEDEDIFNQSSITSFLLRFYLEQVIFKGQDIILPYFGNTILFHIDDVVPIPFSSDQNTKCAEFYRVVANTRWVISTFEQTDKVDLLSSVGGLSDITNLLQTTMRKALTQNSKSTRVLRGILLYGPPGAGKTLLVRALAQEADADFYELKYDELYSKLLGETESRLKSFFSRVKSSSRAVVVLDRIHSICPKRSATVEATDLERRVLYLLNSFFDDLHQCDSNFVVLATTYDTDSIAPPIRRLGRLEMEVEIPVPGPTARLDILTKLLNGIPHQLTKDNIWSVAQTAHGLVGADLAALVSGALSNMSDEGHQVLTRNHLFDAQKKIHPSAMKEVLVNVPDVRWSDIGGQEDLKFKLRQIVEWPITHPESFARLGIRQPRGVLMFGPPGCSKTMIAKALASEGKLNFLSIKGPELFNKWLGESERAVRSVFRRARQVAPAIIFFDEIDALGGERTTDSGSSSNVEDRVLSQLLVEMNGIELLENVFIVAATNRPDLMDKALLRPGRLDHKVYVPLPDAETRRKILTIQMAKMPIESVDLDDLIRATDGYSGAEIVGVCHEAALIAMSNDINCCSVSSEYFEAALSLIVPRTSPELLKIYDEFVK